MFAKLIYENSETRQKEIPVAIPNLSFCMIALLSTTISWAGSPSKLEPLEPHLLDSSEFAELTRTHPVWCSKRGDDGVSCDAMLIFDPVAYNQVALTEIKIWREGAKTIKRSVTRPFSQTKHGLCIPRDIYQSQAVSVFASAPSGRFGRNNDEYPLSAEESARLKQNWASTQEFTLRDRKNSDLFCLSVFKVGRSEQHLVANASWRSGDFQLIESGLHAEVFEALTMDPGLRYREIE